MRGIILYCAILCQVVFWVGYRLNSNWHDFIYLAASLVLAAMWLAIRVRAESKGKKRS